MRTFKLRNGQWLKFKLPAGPLRVLIPPDQEVAKAAKKKLSQLPALVPATISDVDELAVICKTIHRTPGTDGGDGHFVGIYSAEGVDPLSRRYVPGHIACVRQTTGINVRFLHAGTAVLLALDPDAVEDLQSCASRDELPQDRLKNTPESWQPR